MLASPSQAPTNKVTTVVEVDAYLTAIANALKHGKNPDRELGFKRADRWLDLRLEISEGGE